MGKILQPNAVELAKWRKQADKAAPILKSRSTIFAASKDTVEVAFVFNDAIVKVGLKLEDVKRLETADLADALYQQVVAATRAKVGH